MISLKVYSPVIGKLINLDKVVDPVFAGRRVGDGVAVEPSVGMLYAPCSGVIKSIHSSKHAITLTNKLGVDILMHVGIDTVNLNGKGFETLVKEGDKVELHQELLKFDIEYIKANATSTQIPILLVDIDNNKFGYTLEFTKSNITQNDVVIELVDKKSKSLANEAPVVEANTVKSNIIIIKNENGIHARPASLLSNIAKHEKFNMFIHVGDKKSNLKSVVSIMGLNIKQNDEIYFSAETNNPDVFLPLYDVVNSFAAHDDTADKAKEGIITSKVDGNKFYGLGISDGVVVAKIAARSAVDFKLKETADNYIAELQTLYTAIKQLSKNLEYSLSDSTVSAKYKDILNAHISILNDPELLQTCEKLIKGKHNTAEFAVSTAVAEQIKSIEATGNKLLIERVSDFKDVANQLIMQIKGDAQLKVEFSEPTIVLAHDFVPSDLVSFGNNVVGLASVMGGATSHVSIMAKSKGIPLIIALDPHVLDNVPSGKVILNSQIHCLNLQPSTEELKEAGVLIDKITKLKEENQSNINKPVVTTDGFAVRVLANVINKQEVEKSVEVACDGVGLFRTEFVYFDQEHMPTVAEQVAIYSKLVEANKGRDFVIRTLDAGGEKQLSYLKLPHELNPVLGVRGIRLSLEYRSVLEEQLLAIFQVADENCKIMIPMVTDLFEYRQVKQIIEELKLKHNITKKLELGIMVEVPSAAIMADIYAQEVDFFSIGTNDLSQYVLAIDRDHNQLAGQIDHLHPAVIRCLEMVVKAGAKYNKPVSICGLMASDYVAIPVLVGLGVKNLSMNLSVVPSNKALIRRLSKVKCDEIVSKVKNMAGAAEVREYIKSQIQF